MRELRYPDPVRGRLHIATLDYTAVDWHAIFAERILHVTIEVPELGLPFGETPLNLTLRVPGHVVVGVRMDLTGPIKFLDNNLAAMKWHGHQLYLNA
jgi:hypothetical protein